MKFIKIQTVGNATKLSETWKEGIANTKGGTGFETLTDIPNN